MCEHGVFLGCKHCVVDMRWFNGCQGVSKNKPFTHDVSRFLKQAYILLNATNHPHVQHLTEY
jgi:hypothetical protein